jgi:hypothetical protein
LMHSQYVDETQIRTNAVGVRNIGEIPTRHFKAVKLSDLSLRLTAGTPGPGGGGVRLCFPLGMSLWWRNLRSSKLSRPHYHMWEGFVVKRSFCLNGVSSIPNTEVLTV